MSCVPIRLVRFADGMAGEEAHELRLEISGRGEFSGRRISNGGPKAYFTLGQLDNDIATLCSDRCRGTREFKMIKHLAYAVEPDTVGHATIGYALNHHEHICRIVGQAACDVTVMANPSCHWMVSLLEFLPPGALLNVLPNHFDG